MPQEIRLEALDLASIIRPGDNIVWGAGPPALVEKLLEQRHRIGHANVFLAGGRIKPEHADVLTFTSGRHAPRDSIAPVAAQRLFRERRTPRRRRDGASERAGRE